MKKAKFIRGRSKLSTKMNKIHPKRLSKGQGVKSILGKDNLRKNRLQKKYLLKSSNGVSDNIKKMKTINGTAKK